jgi:hypothetical protein
MEEERRNNYSSLNSHIDVGLIRAETMTSRQGNPLINYNNKKYRKQRQEKEVSYWVCLKCNARLTVFEKNNVLFIKPEFITQHSCN